MASMEKRGSAAAGTSELMEALASTQRTAILDLLTKTPSTVPEIALKVGMKPISVRFHLQKLLSLGLVQETKQRGHVGRPRHLYRATKTNFEVAFPPRSYRHLASALLRTLMSEPDWAQVSRNLRKVGRDMGSEIGRGLKQGAGVVKWDGPALKKHLVEGVMAEFGTQPETVKCTEESIQYRFNNCPFKELAAEYPQVVCEQLDDSISIAMLKELDKDIDWRKLKCMGHGDSYCEYVATTGAAVKRLSPPLQV